ncbi:MAG: sigma-70 family RNA polymerase sigma factor [Deltaproteobacteria bacterium]|nr:sigma-70 family RNA polymerase sigma factor [Deltaproteobacteria bacterium]MBW2123373.1 sigma-70 family RNA polymerase sigma factor [Deltaproteobacteria bacterium]
MSPYPLPGSRLFQFSDYREDPDDQETGLSPSHGAATTDPLVIEMVHLQPDPHQGPGQARAKASGLTRQAVRDGRTYAGESSITGVYLEEINRFPLLTRKREIQIAKKIEESSRKLRDLLLRCPSVVREFQHPWNEPPKRGTPSHWKEDLVPKVIGHLGKEAESAGAHSSGLKELIKELKRAEAELKSAKAEMIQANLRLVVSIAKIYINRGLSFLDLIQEGNMGLMKAVTRYDYRKGFKFSTYASWWIRQAMTRALADKSRTIRIPNHLLETRSKASKASQQLIRDLGRDPLPEEVAERARLPLNNLLKSMSLAREPISLETPVGDDGGTLQDLLEGEQNADFGEELLERIDLTAKVNNLLCLLDPREQEILRLRFGIGLASPRTLEEVGKRFGISRERVRQIEERALRKLKSPVRSDTNRAESL